jgi:hypothetical protein
MPRSAGKHVVCEKPLCMTLEEADLMIETCQRHGVLLLYAEELFFTPKYVKAKQMADEGAFGKVYLVKQAEKHFGPHAPWFWDVERSGGGVSWTWAVTESPSAIGSSVGPSSRVFIARWTPTFMQTKPGAKMTRSVSLSSRRGQGFG